MSVAATTAIDGASSASNASSASAASGARADGLRDAHALVTGGARGIGYACAQALLERGACVTIVGRDAAALAAAREKLSRLPGARVFATTVDIGDAASVASAFDQARATFGPLAMLINNAGQATSAPFIKTDAAAWQHMIDVNLGGTFHCTQAALPDMLAARYGRIVNVASTAGLIGYAYVAAYCAAKHGVIGLTRALALELAKKGVTVNAVCPGYTETDIVREAVANIVAKTGRSAEEARGELAQRNPQGRLVTPEEVADTVAWLCRAASASITGQAIAVAGGEVATG